MSILGKLLKTTIDVVTIPVSVVADVVTIGGVTVEKDTTFTGDNVKTVLKDAVDVYDEVEKL